MAHGVGFEGANVVLQAPPGVSQDECFDLQVFRDGRQVISCWRLTDEELKQVTETGVVWLGIMGALVPPCYVTGVSPLKRDDGSPVKVEPYIPPAPRRDKPPPPDDKTPA